MLNVYRIAVFIQFKSKVSRVDYITIRSFYDNADCVRYGVSYIKEFYFQFSQIYNTGGGHLFLFSTLACGGIHPAFFE